MKSKVVRAVVDANLFTSPWRRWRRVLGWLYLSPVKPHSSNWMKQETAVSLRDKKGNVLRSWEKEGRKRDSGSIRGQRDMDHFLPAVLFDWWVVEVGGWFGQRGNRAAWLAAGPRCRMKEERGSSGTVMTTVQREFTHPTLPNRQLGEYL